MTNNPKTIRVATTVTNAREGTLGAEVPNAFAACDVLDTAMDQFRKLRDLGLITAIQYQDALEAVNKAHSIAQRVFMDRAEKNSREFRESVARYEARQKLAVVRAG